MEELSIASTSQKRKNTSPTDSEDDNKKGRLINIEEVERAEKGQNAWSNPYIKGGLARNVHGAIYQLKVLMLFLERAVANKYEFQLGTEVIAAGSFDDVVFKYKKNEEQESERSKIRFVQVKHTQNDSEKITASDLLNSNNGAFSLQKYFVSYRKIVKNPEFNVDNLDFILFSNIKLDTFENLKKSGIEFDPIEEYDNILNINSRILYKIKQNNIDHELYKKLRETSDVYLLAKELKHHFVKNKQIQLRSDILKLYHVRLCEKVFEIVEKTNEKEVSKFIKFRTDFLDGTSDDLEIRNFRKVLQQDAIQLSLWKKEIPVSLPFGKSKSELEKDKCNINDFMMFEEKSELPSDTVDDKEIENFFEQLIFAVDQPNEEKLSKIIANELGEDSQFNLLNADVVAHSFQEKMLNWFKQKQGVWLDAKSGNKFLNEIEYQINILLSVGLSLAYSEELQEYGIKFKSEKLVGELKTFLSPETADKVLHIGVQEESVLTAINVCEGMKTLKLTNDQYKKQDSYIFMTLKALLRPKSQVRAMDAFESRNNLLIISCELAASQYAVEDSIIILGHVLTRILKQSNEKKIILIADDKQCRNLFFELDSKFIKRITDDSNFSDLRERSKNHILQKKVIFQGEEVILQELYLKKINRQQYDRQKNRSNSESSGEETDFKNDSLGDETDINNESSGEETDINNESSGEETDYTLTNLSGNCRINIDRKTLKQLICNEPIKIGCRQLKTSVLEGAYCELQEKIKKEVLFENLSDNASSKKGEIYVISGQPGSTVKNTLIEEFTEKFKDQIEILDESVDTKVNDSKPIQLYFDKFNDCDFENICHKQSKKIIYWINIKISVSKDNGHEYVLAKIYNPNFYIKGKRFKSEVVIGKNVKELIANSELSEIFFIDGINKQDFQKWIEFNNDEYTNFEKNCKNKIKFAKRNKVKFQKLMANNKHRIVHLLKFVDDRLIWLETQNSLQLLSQYKVKDNDNNNLIEEDDLIKEMRLKKVVIIAGCPGMGKSTTLVKLLQREEKSHWLLRVNLKDHLKEIREINFVHNEILEVTEFLSKFDKNLSDNFTKDLLNRALVNDDFGKPLLIAFDGFDEVLDEKDREKIIKLLKHLKDKTKAKFWVTTRLHYQQTLEVELSTFAVNIYPMKNLVKGFIKNYLKIRLRLMLNKDLFELIFFKTESVIRIYTDQFLNKIRNVFKPDVTKINGSPLLLNLMLESSPDDIVKWSKGTNEVDFSYLGNDIWEVYEKFIERKHEIYFKKMGIEEESKRIQEEKIFYGYYKDLAKAFVWQSDHDTAPFEHEKRLEELASEGCTINFIHPTLREYFAAKYYINWIEKASNRLSNLRKKEYLLKEILLKKDHELIRKFMNLKLLKIKTFDERTLKQFQKLLKMSWKEKNHNGQTILHVAFQEINHGIVNFLFRVIKTESSNVDLIRDLLKERDNNHDTVLYAAARNQLDKNNDFGLNKLFEVMEDNDIIQDAQQKIILSSMFRKIQQLDDPFIALLVNKLKALNSKSNLKRAFDSLNLDVVKWVKIRDFVNEFEKESLKSNEILFKEFKEIYEDCKKLNKNISYYLLKAVTSKGNNILHITARAGLYDAVKWVVEKEEEEEENVDVNAVCNKGRTALHKAARAGSLQIVLYLLEKGAKPNVKDNWGNIPLSDALKSRNFELINFLLKETQVNFGFNITDKNIVDACEKGLLIIDLKRVG